jgi:hypothetical protein
MAKNRLRAVACVPEPQTARALPDIVRKSVVNPFIVTPRLMALAAAATAAHGLVSPSAGVVFEVD